MADPSDAEIWGQRGGEIRAVGATGAFGKELREEDAADEAVVAFQRAFAREEADLEVVVGGFSS